MCLKTKSMKRFFILVVLCGCTSIYGQYSDPKFGKVEIPELSMTKYDLDTTAGALILYDYGNTEFILNRENSFQYVFERHFQKKIFKKSAFDNVGNFSFRLFNNSTRKEDLRNLKAVTYNLVDGKIVKTKLDNDKIYRAEGKNYTDLTFAFPELKEGSIVELSLSIISDFLYDFRGWNFQYEYPAIWSQYTYTIPEYFSYREASKGYLQFEINKKEQVSSVFQINEEREVNPSFFDNKATHQPQTLKAKSIKTTLSLKDVPAFISEPNIDCEDNYIQSIEFELNSVEYPGQSRKDYTQTWESVNTQMIEDVDFGVLLRSDGFIKDTITAICKNKFSDIDKAVAIYNYVQNRMKWNGAYRKWALKGIRKPYNDRVGSSSEINLLLTLMLQTAGIKADPVLFSTRDNGIALTFYPTINKFNSVLTRAQIEGKVILLDAVSKNCPFGTLPANDINGKGRVVNKLSGDWADLNTDTKYNEVKKYYLQLDPDGKISGTMTGKYDGYAGILSRSSLKSAKNDEDYIRKLQEDTKGLTINKYFFSDKNNNYTSFTDTLKVELTDNTETIGDKILFNPLLFEKIEKNRYTLENRKYPVDYNYPISETYIFYYSLPAGYQVESLPQSVSMKLPDNSISVIYNASKSGNIIKVEYHRDIRKILFLPEEYAGLKDFYDQLVKKHAEQIILKKSA
jgi:hypothetical protein